MFENSSRSKSVKIMLDKILTFSKADILSIWTYNESNTKMKLAAKNDKYKRKASPGEYNIIKIIRKEKDVQLINVNNDKKIKNSAFVKNNKLGFLIVVPMYSGKEKIGIALLYYKKYSNPGKAKLSRLSGMIQYQALIMHNKYLKKKIKTLDKVVNVDSLTKLFDHGSFHEMLVKEILRAQRFKHAVSVMMIDIDHFKKFNDTYGHPAGDRVLTIIADIIRNCVRSYDVPFRYGGEEIAIICPHTKRLQVMPVAQRIRKEIEKYPFYAGRKKESIRLTISIGISSYPENAISKNELVEKADQALYLAKEEGRNRVCSSLKSGKEMLKLAYWSTSFTSPFYLSVLNDIKEVVDEVGNVELNVNSPERESNYKQQREIIDQFIEMKVDCIALCSMERELLAKKILEINKAGIKVFMFNTPVELSHSDVVSYVGYKNIEAGREVGRYLVRLLKKKGKVAILEGLDEITSNERKEGFMEIIRKHKNIEVVASIRANWEKDIAEQAADKIIQKHPDIDAIFGVSDEMALGAVDVVIDKGRDGEIFVIGLDGTPQAFESIKNNSLTATLNTNAIEMGRALMRTILRSKIKSEKIDKFIWLPVMIVDLENVNYFL